MTTTYPTAADYPTVDNTCHGADGTIRACCYRRRIAGVWTCVNCGDPR